METEQKKTKKQKTPLHQRPWVIIVSLFFIVGNLWRLVSGGFESDNDQGKGNPAPLSEGVAEEAPVGKEAPVGIEAPVVQKEILFSDGEYWNGDSTPEDWVRMCDAASGITQKLYFHLTKVSEIDGVVDRATAYLVANGGYTLGAFEAEMRDATINPGALRFKRSAKCTMLINVRGIFEGSQVARSVQVYVSEFLVKDGEVLAHDVGSNFPEADRWIELNSN